MKKYLKIIGAVLCLLVFSVALKSCKKTDEQAAVSANTDATNAALQKQLKDNPGIAAIIFPVNQQVATHFENLAGETITSKNIVVNSFTYQCLPADEMDNPPAATLLTVARLYDCVQGYKFTLTWKVSTSVNLINGSGSAVTRGRIRIKNIFGTTLYSNTSITPATITLIGDDPTTGNANHIYNVAYTTAWLPFSYFTPNTTVFEHSLAAYTDCPDAPSIVTAYLSSGIGLDASTPCNRVDPVAINGACVSGGTYIDNGSATGFKYILSTGYPCPYPAVYPDRQEVQVKCMVSGSEDVGWRHITPTSSVPSPPGTIGNLYPYNPTTQTSTIDPASQYYFSTTDIKPIAASGLKPPTHGLYKVRFRNRMMPLASGCYGDWSPEILTML